MTAMVTGRAARRLPACASAWWCAWAPKPTGILRFVSTVQIVGSLLAVPLGLASGYSIYKANFAPETTCQQLRGSIISMLDKNVDAATRRMLVRRDVEAFEQNCGGVDPDAHAAFKRLLAAEMPAAKAQLAVPMPKADPKPDVRVVKIEPKPEAKAKPELKVEKVEAKVEPSPKPRSKPMSEAGAESSNARSRPKPNRKSHLRLNQKPKRKPSRCNARPPCRIRAGWRRCGKRWSSTRSRSNRRGRCCSSHGP